MKETELIRTADKIITSLDNKAEDINLPGGEVTVWHKQMSPFRSLLALTKYAAYFLKDGVISSDIDEYRSRSVKSYFRIYYEPPIPDEYWKAQVRSTREIQLRETLLRIYPDMAMAERLFGTRR